MAAQQQPLYQRFNPSRFFRRRSSRGDTSSESSPAVSPGDTSVVVDKSEGKEGTLLSGGRAFACGRISGLAAAAPLALGSSRGGVRKSKSLPRLRKKFSIATAEDPEEVVEGRESVSLGLDLGAANLDRELKRDVAATGKAEVASLASSRAEEPGTLHTAETKTPEVNTQELKLDLEQIVPPSLPHPLVVVEQATPDLGPEIAHVEATNTTPSCTAPPPADAIISYSPETTRKLQQHVGNDHLSRPLSLLDTANLPVVKTLLDSPFVEQHLSSSADSDSRPHPPPLPNTNTLASMAQRKIWVKRPGASATLVQVREDDLVDDVREMILRKYANSLGKTFDAPDMTLSIVSRAENGQYRNERTLGPEEEMCRTIDSYYSGGQTVDDALIINVPQRRTPRASPRVFHNATYQALDDYRPLENGTDYFPIMPTVIPATMPQTTASHDSRGGQQQQQQPQQQYQHPEQLQQPQHHYHPRSISVLNTGQVPPIPMPSPGGTTSRRFHRDGRPKVGRQPTSSPTILPHNSSNNSNSNNNPLSTTATAGHMVHRASTRPRLDSSTSEALRPENGGGGPLPSITQQAVHTPPASDVHPATTSKNPSQPPTPSAATAGGNNSARPSQRPRRSRKLTPEERAGTRTWNKNDPAPSANPALDNAAVPPINVLIVEDNIINLRILEGLMKRLKVRWQTAMNGQIAVDKWKAGGFHLLLMDIQMPVMNGLQATKEIRRLERVNGIGVFGEVDHLHSHSSSQQASQDENSDADALSKVKTAAEEGEGDKLAISSSLFKSPVIIVALTASSLQSDRHEALAAGCNDFLNKPVNMVWLERKVKEWGCMQALIDYDGWRLWKDYAVNLEKNMSAEEKAKLAEKEVKAREREAKMAKLAEKQGKLKAERQREEERRKRESSDGAGGVSGGPAALMAGAGVTEGMNEATAALKTGAENLREAGFAGT